MTSDYDVNRNPMLTTFCQRDFVNVPSKNRNSRISKSQEIGTQEYRKVKKSGLKNIEKSKNRDIGNQDQDNAIQLLIEEDTKS